MLSMTSLAASVSEIAIQPHTTEESEMVTAKWFIINCEKRIVGFWGHDGAESPFNHICVMK